MPNPDLAEEVLHGAKDRQTVTPEGARVGPSIDGVRVRPAVTHPDDRGEVCEIFDPRWGIDPSAMVYAYQATIRPGKVKGWIVHRFQEDRVFASWGYMRWVLYDARPESPTRGQVQEIYLSERNRALMVIPRGVFHAVQNVGTFDAAFVNLPTRPYNHADPDKFRLPLDTDQIPYRFPA